MLYQDLLNRAYTELGFRTQQQTRIWNYGKETSWSLNQDEGILHWQFADGLKVQAPAQIVGSYNEERGTWLWSWANSHIEPAMMQHSMLVKQYGEDNDIEMLYEGGCECALSEAWQLAALTMYLNQQQGVYKGTAGPGVHAFLCFGEVTLNPD